MKLSVETLNSSNYDVLYSRVSSIAKKMYFLFQIIGIDVESYKIIVHQIIEESKNIHISEKSYELFFEGKLQEELKRKTAEVAKEEKDFEEILNKALEKRLYSNPNSHIKAIGNVNKVKNLSDYFGIQLTEDLIQKLLDCNTDLNRSLEIIFKKHEKQIKSGRIDEIYSNENVILMIEAYCMKNNIEIEEPVEEERNDKDDIDDMDIASDELAIYLKEISQYPLLTKEEEIALAEKITNQDKDAFEKLVNSNLRLVVSMAKRYVNRGLPLMDIIQDGNIGLVTAAKKFDGSKGYKFSTYAYWWIRQSITRGIQDKSKTIRIPVRVQEEIMEFNKTVDALFRKLNREPTEEEIAQEMGIPLKKIYDFISYQIEPVSLNQPLDSGSDSPEELGSFVSSNDNTEDEVTNSALWETAKNILKRKKIKQRDIELFEERMGLDGRGIRTLDTIGKEYGITRERARQIEGKIIKILRSPENRALLNGELQKAPNPKGNNLCETINSKNNNKEETIEELIQEISKKSNIRPRELEMFLSKIGIYDGIKKTAEEVAEIFEVSKNRVQQAVTSVRFAIRNSNGAYFAYKKLLQKAEIKQNDTQEKQLEEIEKVINILKEGMRKDIEMISSICSFSQDQKELMCLYYGLIDNKKKDQKILSTYYGVAQKTIDTCIKRINSLIERNKSAKELFDKLLTSIEDEKKENKNMSRKMTPLYILLGCTKEELERALPILTESEMELFRKRNGNDIDNPISTMNTKESKDFTNLTRILRKAIKDPYYTRKDYTIKKDKNIEKEAVVHETEQEKEVETKCELSKEDFTIIREMLKSPSMKELLESLPNETAIIAMLRFGYFDNKYFSTEAIANFLDISEEEVREAVKSSLTLYKERAISYIDKAILSTELSKDDTPLLGKK